MGQRKQRLISVYVGLVPIESWHVTTRAELPWNEVTTVRGGGVTRGVVEPFKWGALGLTRISVKYEDWFCGFMNVVEMTADLFQGTGVDRLELD